MRECQSMKNNNEEEIICMFCKKKINSSRKINVCSSCRKRSKDTLFTAAIGIFGVVNISKKIK